MFELDKVYFSKNENEYIVVLFVKQLPAYRKVCFLVLGYEKVYIEFLTKQKEQRIVSRFTKIS